MSTPSTPTTHLPAVDISLPSYVPVLGVVAVVVLLGLLLSGLYYCWKKGSRGHLELVSPGRDAEQLRGEAEEHVQIPGIPLCSPHNLKQMPSPSIFSRGDFVLEVLDDLEYASSTSSGSTRNVDAGSQHTVIEVDNSIVKACNKDHRQISVASEQLPVTNSFAFEISRPCTPGPSPPSTGSPSTCPGLRLRQNSQAGASIAAMRGSLYSEDEDDMGVMNVHEDLVQIYEDQIEEDKQLETGAVDLLYENTVMTEDDVVLTVDEDKYLLEQPKCMEFKSNDDENLDTEEVFVIAKNENCPQGLDKFPPSPNGCSDNSSVNIMITPAPPTTTLSSSSPCLLDTMSSLHTEKAVSSVLGRSVTELPRTPLSCADSQYTPVYSRRKCESSMVSMRMSTDL